MTLSLDLNTLLRGYATADLTPEAVVTEVYARIAARGERPVWITLVPQEQALAKLREASKGPLYGIPFAVKDNIDVAGLPTTCACPEFAYTPQRSATVVERLEAAGAILIGKTNMDQFATGLVGTRSPYGIPSSVFNADYISGGSSAGSAVAVAAGLVSFSLGTDTAGSGRVPAGFNNIVGLKPTKGVISTRGVIPACRTQDAISIFGLTTSDAAQVLAVAGQYDAEDAYSRPLPGGFAVLAPPAKLRVGVPAGALEFFGDREAEALYRGTIERLARDGATIVDIDFAPFREVAELLYSGPWVAERLAAIKDFAATKPESIHEVVRGIILGAGKHTAVGAFEGFYGLAELTRTAETEWQKMDTMLLPTTGTTYTIAELLADPVRLNSNLGAYTNFVNLMDLSAIAIPAGFRPNGLPFGVTVIGRAFEDGQLAAIADKVHRLAGATKLGGTQTALDATPAIVPSALSANRIKLAVVGAHLTGQPLNKQLTERHAKLLTNARTAAGYRLFALPGTTPPKPGLIYDGTGAGGIEVEVWELDAAGFGSFVALIPAPLGIGTLKLADGTAVHGFLCEAHATSGAVEITAFGGWRGWLAAQIVNRPS
jgi:allophanate hydrolase